MQSIKMLYLTALPNSGSTLVALLANSHPDVVSPGELMGPGGKYHGPEGPECACGEVVAKCPFWSEVGKRMQDHGHRWRPDYWALMHDRQNRPTPGWERLLFGRPGPNLIRDRFCENVPGLRGVVLGLRNRNLDIARCVLEVSGRSCLLDTSKPPERMARLARTPGIDLRVIHMIRDPRGWCNSRVKKTNSPIRPLLPIWVRRNQYIESLASLIPPEKRLLVRYEELCKDPQAIMNRIYALAGLTPSPLPEDMRTIQAHLLGNRMRNRGDSRIQEDTSWRDQLSRSDVTLIEKKTRKTASKFGYLFSDA